MILGVHHAIRSYCTVHRRRVQILAAHGAVRRVKAQTTGGTTLGSPSRLGHVPAWFVDRRGTAKNQRERSGGRGETE